MDCLNTILVIFNLIYFSFSFIFWQIVGQIKLKNCVSIKPSLKKKTVLITGANRGIGNAIAHLLAQNGAKVIITSRDLKKGEEAVEEIKYKTENEDVFCYQLDLNSFQSVHSFAQKILQEQSKVDILINNAGVLAGEPFITEDGFEQHMQVNFLSPMLITKLLLPVLVKSSAARVINVGSDGLFATRFLTLDLTFKKYHSTFRNYASSKLFQAVYSQYLSRQLLEHNISVNTVHPGLVNTNVAGLKETLFITIAKIVVFSIPYLAISPQLCAKIYLYFCCNESLDGITGQHFSQLSKRDLFKLPSNIRDEFIDNTNRILSEEIHKFSLKFRP